MNIVKTFDNAYERAKAKNWDYIYILVDMHGTIFTPSYLKEENYKYYPYAKEVLQLLSLYTDTKLILWTSTRPIDTIEYQKVFMNDDIYFDYLNENPEVERQPTDPESLDLNQKFYFNIGIDDKFGFEPETDWKLIYDYLNN